MSSRPRFAFSSRRSRRHMASVLEASAGVSAAGSSESPAGASAATIAPKVGGDAPDGARVVLTPAASSTHSQRDPRLGSYRDEGVHLHREDVFDVAGIDRSERVTALREYPNGLNALFIACGHEARRRSAKERAIA